MIDPADRAGERLDNLVRLERDQEPSFHRAGDGYRLLVPKLGVTLEIDFLRRAGGQLKGELLVRAEIAGARTLDGVLAVGDINLSSARVRASHAKYLQERARTKAAEFDWVGLLEEFAQRVLVAERTGEPGLWLDELPEPEPDKGLSVDGLELLRHHPACVFGDGGAGKSLLLLYVLGRLAQQGVRVGFLDWELDEREHRRRLRQLFGDALPRIRYVRCSTPLAVEAERLRRIIREDRLEYLALDSISYATDGPAEAHEVAARYVQALRSFGDVGSLHTAHCTKNGETADHKPFGSVFWHNSMRATWNAKTAEVEPNAATLTVGLYHRKSNLGPKRGSLGFQFGFDGDHGPISVNRVDLADVADLAAQLPVGDRLKNLLRRGPLSRDQVRCELEDVAAGTLRQAIARAKAAGVLVEMGDRLSLRYQGDEP